MTTDGDAGPNRRGPEVPNDETLLRAITPNAASTWFPSGIPSSAIFSHPVFSTDVESLTTLEAMLNRWPPGSGIVSFSCGYARSIDFDARLEPEFANNAHANVYCDLPPNQRKRSARQLAEHCQIRIAPN